ADYTSTSDKNRTVSRAELRKAFVHTFGLYPNYRLDTAMGNLMVNGDKAVADAAGRQTFGWPDPKTKQLKVATTTFLRHDYWLKTASGWKIARSIVLPAQRPAQGKTTPRKKK